MQKMNNLMYFLQFLIFSIILLGANATITFNTDTEQCLGQLVQYQCTVTGTAPPVYTLTWKILDDNGGDNSTTAYTSSFLESDSRTIGNVFTTEQLQNDPSIVSTISFTVQSSINGYTILCQDGNLGTENNLTINILDIPNSPSNVMVHTDTFTSTTVNISWSDEPSSFPCFTNYKYSVSSTTIDTTTMTTSNETVLEGLVPSDDVYCVVVASIDTANRTNSSDPVCFVFNVPPEAIITSITNDTATSTTDNITINWMLGDYNVASSVVVPKVISIIVNIFNTSGEFGEDVDDSSNELSPGTLTHTFSYIPKEVNYTIEVIVVNDIGSSSTMQFFLAMPPVVIVTSSSSSIQPTLSSSVVSSLTTSTSVLMTTTVSSTMAVTTASTSSASPTPSVGSASSNVAAAAGGASVGAVILILIVIVVVIALVYFLYLKKDKKSINLMDSGKGGGAGGELALEDKSPEIGQSLYQEIDKPNKPSPKESSTTTETPKSGPTTVAPVEETPTYQDPSTIKREQASTGDIYTLPEKKSSLSKATETTPGGLYAELDIHTKKSNGGSSDKPVVIQGSTQPVIYADVRGQ